MRARRPDAHHAVRQERAGHHCQERGSGGGRPGDHAGRNAAGRCGTIEVEKQLQVADFSTTTNISYFGAGAYGAEAASQRFSKSVNQMSCPRLRCWQAWSSRPPSMTPPWTRRQRRSAATRFDRMRCAFDTSTRSSDNVVITPVASDLNPSEPGERLCGPAPTVLLRLRGAADPQRPPASVPPRGARQPLKTGGSALPPRWDGVNAQTSATDAVNSHPPDDPSGKAGRS